MEIGILSWSGNASGFLYLIDFDLPKYSSIFISPSTPSIVYFLAPDPAPEIDLTCRKMAGTKNTF